MQSKDTIKKKISDSKISSKKAMRKVNPNEKSDSKNYSKDGNKSKVKKPSKPL